MRFLFGPFFVAVFFSTLSEFGSFRLSFRQNTFRFMDKIFSGKKSRANFRFSNSAWIPFSFSFLLSSFWRQKTFQKSFKNLPSILFTIHSTGPFLPSSSIPSERQKTFYNFWKKHFGPGSDFQTRSRFLLRSQFLLSSFWRQKSSTHFSRSFYVKNDLQNTHTGLSSPLRTGG